jgi:3-hydroxyisobutyrate dehydrogenase-like beta-hydroxyacid dehydrogenase
VRVGVIGLGNIGGAIAANLLADGHETVFFDRDPTRLEAPGLARGVRVDSAGEVGCELRLRPKEG